MDETAKTGDPVQVGERLLPVAQDAAFTRKTLWVRFADTLLPLGVAGSPYFRLAKAAYRVRVLVGASALLSTWFLPNATAQQKLTAWLLIAIVYLPYSVILLRLSFALDRPSLRVATALGDILVVFMFQAVVPPTRTVALFGYLLMVAFYSYLGGRKAGLLIGGSALAASLSANLFGSAAYMYDPYTIGMFATVVVSMALLLDAGAVEQRLAMQRLSKLRDSLRGVSSSLDLNETLEATAASAREASGADFAAVLLSEASLMEGTLKGLGSYPGVNFRELGGSGELFPSYDAFSTGRTVVVGSFGGSSKYARHVELGGLQFKSMVSAPLRHEAEVIGVLNVFFDEEDEATEEIADFIQAFADQAAIAVARAIAFHRIREADAAKDDFVSTVSHELRTPLTALWGFSETMLKNWARMEEPVRVELLGRVSENAQEMVKLVEQLLDLSRIASGKANTLNVQKLNLRSLVNKGLGSFASALESHKVEVDVDQEIDVNVDPDGFMRVFGNLVTNAAKYSPVASRIVITGRTDGFHALVSVADEGPGIESSDLEHIFERFYRGSPDAVRTRRGTGIGLTIARFHVERHGGKIWVDSKPGKGSAFRFTVPRAYSVKRLEVE